MAQEVRCVELKRSESHGFGFSILGGSGSELPPIVYDIVDDSPASACGQLEAGDVILEVNDRQVTDLTTKEVLKCLRLSQGSVCLKLQRDDIVKEKARQYLESANTLDSLRSAITQQDLAHVKDVLAMKSPARRPAGSVPRVPLVHSPPKGRSRPLPPPGAPPPPDANGHDRPRFETFTMTGDMMLNLSRTPAGERPPPARHSAADGGPEPGRSPPAVSSLHGSRSEDGLQVAPGGEPAATLQDAGGSFDTLLDTGDGPDGRLLWTVNAPADSVPAVQLNGAHTDQTYIGVSGGIGVAHKEADSGSPTSADAPAVPSGGGGGGGGTSPESEDGSDIESLHSFHFSPKAVDLPSAVRLAKRLYQLDGFKKSDVSRHLSKNNEFNRTVADEYLKHFEFTGDSLDVALGKFLDKFALTGETQERERVLVHFSKRYMENNPRSFNSPDACHTLTCALMLLNTDLHVQHVPRKMTCAEFVDNLSELNDGEDFPRETLRSLYQAIKARPLHYATDDEYEEMQAAAPTDLPPGGGGGTNPFLEVPDASKATEYKRGYVMRKCCVEPNGKRTALGKRSWRMFYCTLRDLVLYMHKDENNSRKPGAYDDLHNAIRVHHALATKAEDYFKKQHVFKLQTADQAEYLLQTSDAKELQAWIDTINFVAASLSSAPLPGAVGSQRRFQRPLLPAGITQLNLHDQLLGHERRLTDIEAELTELEAVPAADKPGHQLHHHRYKAAFLRAEATRYRTYSQLLRSKMAQYSQLEPAPPEEDEPATPAPPAAAAAVSVPPAADRGRPARPTDSDGDRPPAADAAGQGQEPPQTPAPTPAPAGGGHTAPPPTKEQLLKKKQQRGDAAAPPTPATAAAQPAHADSPPTAAPAGDDAAGDDAAKKKKRRWWRH